jgi:fluoride exporter
VTVASVIGVGLLGGVGAVARFALDGAVSRRVGREFPYGTLAVNLVGAFVLGVFVGLALSDATYRLLGIGLVGAFTTFSTWAFESHRLGEDRRLGMGVANFAVSLVLGVTAAWAGRHLGMAL